MSFSPVSLQSGQSSTVTITAGIPNLASGMGANGQAAYTCGPFSPPIPVAIGFDKMPETPCAPGNGGPPGSCPLKGKPVNVTTGEEQYTTTDLSLSGPFGLTFSRTYDSMTIGAQTVDSTAYGPTALGSAGWQSLYDAYVYDDAADAQFVFHDELGQYHYLTPPAANGSSSYNSLSGMTFAINAAGSQWTVTSWDGRAWVFNAKGELIARRDRIGNVQTLYRDTTAGHNDRVTHVSDPLGRELCFFYDGSNRITGLAWQGSGACPASLPSSGTTVRMAYDSGTNCTTGQLCSVTEPDGRTWTYQYNNADPTFPNGLIAVVDPYGNYEERNTYAGGQVVTQSSGNCSTTFPCSNTGNYLRFAYPNNGANQTVVTDGLGRTTTFTYDIDLYLLGEESGPLCDCGGDQTRYYSFDSDERLHSVSDDGINGTIPHTITYSYGRDANAYFYPSPTASVENIDTSGTLRTLMFAYYPLGTPQQDLVQVTTLPSVDKGGSATTTIGDTYSTAGLLTQRTKTGFVNGVSTPYTWKWSYDSRGRLQQRTGPRATTPAELTTYGYFADNDGDRARAGQLRTVTDAFGHVTSFSAATGFTSYDVFGGPQSKTDPNGAVTEYAYDARGRMLSSTLLGVTGDPANLVSSWIYDAAGRVSKMLEPAGNGALFSYDSSDRPTAIVRLDDTGLEHERLSLQYNYNDQIVQRTAQACSVPAASCAAWVTTYTSKYAYSPSTSNLTAISNADGTQKTFSYVDSGPLHTYNDENHATGADYTFNYDLAGRKIGETRFLSGSSGGVVSTYGYDLHDNLSTLTDPNGNVTSYHHDDFDRVAVETSPVAGVTHYGYDADSNLTSSTDANGATITNAYDSLNRRRTESAVKGATTLASAWAYDDATAGHFGIGRLATMTDPSGSSAYTYERRGNVAVENRQIVGNSFTQAYAYDPNANRATLTYPDGYVVTTGYDFADRPSSSSHTGTLSASQLAALAAHGLAAPSHAAVPEMRGRASAARIATGTTRIPRGSALRPPLAGRSQRAVSADAFVTSATYEPFGPIDRIAYGNGTTQTIAWNTRYLPTRNLLAATATLAEYTYSEDKAGNVLAIADNVNAGYDRTFQFDDLNRLTSADSGTSLWGTATGNGYTYDAMGDVKTLQLGATRKDAFTYRKGTGPSAGLPEILSVDQNGTSLSVSYDAAGNELGDGTSTFSYSPRELLGSDSRFVGAYYYDGFRQRVATTLAAGSDRRDSFFDRSRNLLAETAEFTSGTPAIAYKYVWLGDRPVAQVDAAGTHWTFTDHLGTPLAQTGAGATITWQAEYEPYGQTVAVRVGSTLHQPLRFPGQSSEQFDSGANGLTERSFNNARWYRPGWGRYTQADPAGTRISEDLYAYADDRPLNWDDPSGLDASGLCVGMPYILPGMQHVFGCYCGQHYTNGQNLSETASPSTHIGPPFGPAPWGPVDNCCMHHDACLHDTNSKCYATPAAGAKARCTCDTGLFGCERNAFKPGTYANYPLTYAAQAAVTSVVAGPAAVAFGGNCI
jgi:RHS repeat-associated protein